MLKLTLLLKYGTKKMKNELNIFVRKDLNMRKGKMAAQSAHAAMKLFLEAMCFKDNKLFLNTENEKCLLSFLENPVVNIVMVADESLFDSAPQKDLPFSVIIDNGRTEFHGVPTKTCSAQGIFISKAEHELYVPQTYGEGIKAKELFVFSKESPLSKEEACSLAVILCLEMLYNQMDTNDSGEKYIDLDKDCALSDWISGAFGKIAVAAKTSDEFDNLKSTLTENNFKYIERKFNNSRCMVIEPQKPITIDPFTRQLSLI